jgi:hypothetical protein
MNKNPILEEIWRVREEIARESEHDIHAMAEAARKREAQLVAQGWKLVSFADEAKHEESCVVREEPPEK